MCTGVATVATVLIESDIYHLCKPDYICYMYSLIGLVL